MKVVKVGRKPRGGSRWGIVLVVLLLILGLFAALTTFITDWMWFREMGYVSVFFKKLITQLQIGIPLFIAVSLLIDLYLRHLKKRYFEKIESHEETDLKRLTRITRIIAVIFGAVISLYAVEKLWFNLLQFLNSTKVETKDPIFHLDISFYLFRLTFLKDLNGLLISVILIFILMTLLYYGVLIKLHSPDVFERDYTAVPPGQESTGPEGAFWETPLGQASQEVRERFGKKRGRRFDRDNVIGLGSIASAQLITLGVIFYLMLALEFFFRQFDLLHDHTGAVYGAGFVDVNVRLWLYRLLVLICLAGAFTVVHHIHKREFKKLVRVPVVLMAVGLAGSLVAVGVQNLIVSPDELNKESAYLSRNIKYTQFAYDLDHVRVDRFPANENLTSADISKNEQTFTNVRINDYDPVKTFYNQTQSIRQYYTFNDVDVDRYQINGKLTQTYLSPREIDESKISGTWLNHHLKYTHGYGVTLSQVNAVTASGQPDVLVKNIPPESSTKSIQISRPEIYFGEMTNDYTLVDTKEDEFDYPDGSRNRYTKYTGKAGIRLNPFARIMFALREHSLKLLVSTNLNSQSRIMINRNIEKRVKTIMPYLKYDDDPYAVTVNGRIYWIVDAYATSSLYPYSEPYSDEVGTSNYIRNSVKVVVDAYNGDVNYYIVDQDEPIARTYQKIYPKLFKDFDQMPKELRSHIRYPNDMFTIQARIYSKYHMNNVKVFYQDEDRWDIANEIYGTKQTAMTPNYFIVKLPGEKKAEFINSVPFTPKSKQNMTALLIARNDGDHYGKLVLYQFPKSKTVYGPMQVEAQIDQNTKISQDFSLWSSSGSQYSRGNLFVIPVEDSLLYVEPVYLEASNSAIPEVKRVIVVYGDRIAYESTLGDALESLFGSTGGTTTEENAKDDGKESRSGETKTTMDYIRDAQKAYNAAQDALKDGNWSEYGKQMDALEEALNSVKK